MKIERISVYALDLPFAEGAYRCRNRTESGFASTLVEIETDAKKYSPREQVALTVRLAAVTPAANSL